MRKHINLNEGWKPFSERLQQRQPFESAASSRGFPVSDPQMPTQASYWISFFGWMPSDDPNNNIGLEDRDYAVYSYRTLVAWHSRSTGWWCPKRSYSQSTSRLITLVREAISHLDD